MDTQLGVFFVVYWLLLGSLYFFGSAYLGDAEPVRIPSIENLSINTTGPTSTDQYYSGEVSTTTAILKTLGFVFFGIGLPSNTPVFLLVIFSIVQTGITIVGILFIVGVLRGG